MSRKRIQVLPEHLANQIAAGEVIQRPESVVKELLENALDARATEIIVTIKNGGKNFIQVVDNGEGMDEADAVASFLRHATSKISSLEDLEEIRTYGFRGEALASIAAVAQVTMKSRRREDEAAVVVHIEGGGRHRISREGRQPGTSITVQNLFFNVPARRKFLKTTATEFRHIVDAVQRVALSHPEIAVKFISDDETVLDVKGSSLETRVLDIFGQRQVDGMVWAEETSEYVSLAGYIGKPAFGQKTRANQYLFLNKRYITNRNIAHAVFTAYENLLIKGSFPFFLLFLEIDPKRVDVNVHPSKMEAKFEDDQNIYRFVSTVVRRTLATNDLVPAMSPAYQSDDPGSIGLEFTNRQHSVMRQREFVDRSTGEILFPGSPVDPAHRDDFRRSETDSSMNGADAADLLFRHASENMSGSGKERALEHEFQVPADISPILWQLHKKYILSPIEHGLMIVDQHVAHERILYERALNRLDQNAPASQQLLFPRTVELNAGDYALVQELLPHFEGLGFSIRLFGKNTIVVDGIPQDVRHESEAGIVEELLSIYKEYQQERTMDARDTFAKSFSCKAAIKAGDPLTVPEMQSLLHQLFQTKIPYVCPHGRPVVLKISIDELDRRFGRT